MDIPHYSVNDHLEHSRKIESLLVLIKEHCREEMDFFPPPGRALLVTAADVLEGLEHAFHEYSEGQSGFINLDEITSKSDEPWD